MSQRTKEEDELLQKANEDLIVLEKEQHCLEEIIKMRTEASELRQVIEALESDYTGGGFIAYDPQNPPPRKPLWDVADRVLKRVLDSRLKKSMTVSN